MNRNAEAIYKPRLSLLDYEGCSRIHDEAVNILETVGVEIHDPQALSVLTQAGAASTGNRVTIPESLTAQALESAPSEVMIYDRDGGAAMQLRKGNSYFGGGSDTQYTYDIRTGQRRPAVLGDTANTAKLIDSLENIDFVMSLSLASDVPGKNYHVHEFSQMVRNSSKPILFIAGGKEDVKDILDIAETVAGGAGNLRERPFLVLFTQPSTPLRHSRDSLSKMMLCAARGVPVIYVSAALLGGTAPVTMAGALVLVAAETLSGLVIHQLLFPGAPFITGGATAQLDMQTSVCSYGSPELQLSCTAMVNMAGFWDLPVFSTAGCTDSHLFDPQAGMEAGSSVLFQALSGSNLIHDLGYAGAGSTSSLELLLLGNDIAGMAKYMLRGINFNTETMALDLIKQKGPGANYLSEEHTVAHFRDSLSFPGLQNRLDYHQWETEGKTDYTLRARREIERVLASHRVPDLPREVIAHIDTITRRRDNAVENIK